jgi:hypothetical protein
MVSPVTVLLPTAYFPPVSYFIPLIRCESALIEQMETFPKQTFRNRCEIMTSAGKLNLVVPVTKPNGNHTLTKDIEISYREPWQQHHWKSIQTAYRSSPYFNYYADIIQPLFELKETSLIANNQIIISLLNKIIGLGSKFEFTQDYIKQPVDLIDLRSAISPKKKPEGLSFQEYPQVFSHKFGFVKNLSVLDLIFNLGPDTKRYLIVDCRWSMVDGRLLTND